MPRYKKEEEAESKARVGRPTTPVEDGRWKSIKVPPSVWERLDSLADQKQEPIYKVVGEVVEQSLGVSKPGTILVSLADALVEIGRQFYYGKREISPFLAVTAIRKGKVYGERKWTKTVVKTIMGKDGKPKELKVRTHYKWFVDLDQLYRYCSKHPRIKTESKKILSKIVEEHKNPPKEEVLPDI